ncbi:ribosome-inactivating family protein [Streptomyces griseochromogenes]|uniref:ribosome-inactivating family protein n=1 Tax=Streptomyces griseochromogenes TaxID=68214 RepID=UPI0037AF71FE
MGIAAAAMGATGLGLGATAAQAVEPDASQQVTQGVGDPESTAQASGADTRQQVEEPSDSASAPAAVQEPREHATPADDTGDERNRRDLAQNPAVEYTVDDAEGYTDFVQRVRDAVSEPVPGIQGPYGFHQTRDSDTPIDIRLRSGSGATDPAIDLLVRPNDLYVVGWRNQDHTYLLDGEHVPDPQSYEDARFGASYSALQQATRTRGREGEEHQYARQDIPLGQQAMVNAIRTLASNGSSVPERARAMTVLVQMVSEAARFNGAAQSFTGGVRDRGHTRWYTGAPANAAVQDMENNWADLSAALADLQNGQSVRHPVTINGQQVNSLQQLGVLLSVANRNSLTTTAPSQSPSEPPAAQPLSAPDPAGQQARPWPEPPRSDG